MDYIRFRVGISIDFDKGSDFLDDNIDEWVLYLYWNETNS